MYARILEGDQLRVTTDYADIKRALADKRPIWIELEKQTADTDDLLRDVLQLHPLTIEDIWQVQRNPKIDDYPTYLYVVVHGVRGTKRGMFDLIELDVIIGASYVVTHDPSTIMAKDLCDELARSPKLLAKGPAWVAHAALDRAVDGYLPIVDQLDTQLDELETDTLKKAGTRNGPPVMRRILRFKRMIQQLRRISIHQREILLRLARAEFEEIPRDAVPFYRDVYDHFLRINDLVDGYRDLVSGTLEAYLSVQSNRMNEIMKTLTLISTVMLPLTFIVGLYGMNFQHMPEIHWLYGYPFALALMSAVAGGILLFFRRKGWIGQKERELPD
jgi:magnesium transporter